MPVYKATHALRPDKANPEDKEQTETRLIEAPNTAAAMRYAAQDWITISVCTTSEAITLGASGIKLEKAGE